MDIDGDFDDCTDVVFLVSALQGQTQISSKIADSRLRRNMKIPPVSFLAFN